MLERLIAEIHRRSVWQILALFGATAWAVLEVVDTLIQYGLLPEWAFKGSLGVILLGLPVILATAFIQAGVSRGTGTLFTWRNALLGGVGAFSLLGAAVAVYFLMRVTGIGPAASLAAQGVFEAREPVILADFENAAPDGTLGSMVTEALRIDLLQSSAVTVLSPPKLAEALQRAGRSQTDGLSAEAAREIAVRDGIKAIITGSVGAVGDGFVLTASIIEPESGEPLAAFRETASSEADLLRSIDRLSGRIREKAGESLRSVRARPPLSAVTTPSLEALRIYMRAMERYDGGDRAGAIRLLESAVELDPEFAMAYRRLAVILFSSGRDPPRAREVTIRAYELRSRLTAAERLLAEANYHQLVTGDIARAADAYRELLRLQPDDPVALNNLAMLDLVRGNADEAVELLATAVSGPAETATAHANLVRALWQARHDSAVGPAIDAAIQRYPDNFYVASRRMRHLTMLGEYEAAHAAGDSLRARFGATPAYDYSVSNNLAAIDLARGRLEEAREHMRSITRRTREDDDPADYVFAVSGQAFFELVVARAPERARALLADLEASIEFDGLGVVDLANVAAVAALVGDTALARRARAAIEQVAPPETRAFTDDGTIAYADWAIALVRGEAEAALRAAQRQYDAGGIRCGEGRCTGYYESAVALEQAGRIPEAIVMYERHLAGISFGEVMLTGALTPGVLERLGELYEMQGDSGRAARAWARFAEMWREADPELQPRVRRARERAAALLGRTG